MMDLENDFDALSIAIKKHFGMCTPDLIASPLRKLSKTIEDAQRTIYEQEVKLKELGYDPDKPKLIL